MIRGKRTRGKRKNRRRASEVRRKNDKIKEKRRGIDNCAVVGGDPKSGGGHIERLNRQDRQSLHGKFRKMRDCVLRKSMDREESIGGPSEIRTRDPTLGAGIGFAASNPVPR